MIYDFSSGLNALNQGIAGLGKGLENAYQWQLGEQIVNSLPGLNGQPAAAPAAGGLGSLPAGGYNANGKLPAFAAVSGTPGANGAPSLQGDIGRYAESISKIESGGNYGAIGPNHPKYGRALGKYQVMEANIPEWSREALGRVVSSEEFLANPQIQDAIFASRFGGYVQKYGNPEDAASAWFTGRPRSAKGAGTARDSLGTTGNEYVSRFAQGLGGTQPPAAPTQLTLDQAVSPENNRAPQQLTWEEQRAQGQPAPVQVASLDPNVGLPPASAPVGLPSMAGPGAVSVAPVGGKVLPPEAMAPPGATAFPGSRGAPQAVAPPTAGAGPAPVATASTPPVAPPPPPPREQPSQAAQVAQPAPVRPVAQPAAAFSNGRMDPALKSVIALMIRDPQTRAQGIALYREAIQPKTQHIDLGNSIGIIDASGNIVSQIPKNTFTSVGENSTLVDSSGRVVYQGQPKNKIEIIKGRNGEITGMFDTGAGRLLSPDEMKAHGYTPPQAGNGGRGPMFSGNSVEAQSLNYLVEHGIISEPQAADIGAGKIFDGSDGAKYFFSPRSIVQSAQTGQPPVPERVGDQQGAQPAPGAQTAPSPAAPAPSNAQPQAATGAAPGGVQLTAPKPKPEEKPTEDQAKNRQLYGRTTQQLPIVMQNFDALSQIGDQVGSRIPYGEFVTSEPYQRAYTALTDIASSYLYSVSGAAASPKEVDNLARSMMPLPGEKAGTIADKKARIQQMVESIKTRAGNIPAQQDGGGEWTRYPDGSKVRVKR